MTNQTITFFLHQPGANPTKVEAEPNEHLRDALAKAGAPVEGALVFVGECVESLEDSGDTDSHEPVDDTRSLEELHIENHDHVHCGTCRHVKVEVNFGGDTKRHSFSPATTVATVTAWAKEKFKLDDAASVDLTLQICGTQTRPRPNQHLGEIVEAGRCEICFDLVKEVTPQG